MNDIIEVNLFSWVNMSEVSELFRKYETFVQPIFSHVNKLRLYNHQQSPRRLLPNSLFIFPANLEADCPNTRRPGALGRGGYHCGVSKAELDRRTWMLELVHLKRFSLHRFFKINE